jgi:hypothetical protein
VPNERSLHNAYIHQASFGSNDIGQTPVKQTFNTNSNSADAHVEVIRLETNF